ncbi:MAG: glycosyltransferase family 2 protein [Pseudomonadales bacterium]|nr:glycosyltransferase family 2 protein [Pseudomonadales bacterium]
MKLSVVINTKNAETSLEAALQSVKFADEIVVVDMKSTDNTVLIANKFTKKVYTHDDVGYVEPARNFAISKAKGDWVFILDADEEVPKKLATTILDIISEIPESGEKSGNKIGKAVADCYYIPRQNLIFGKWIEKTGWWPDHVLRLFRKGHVEWSDDIHSIPITSGEVKELPAQKDIAIIHHNYQHVNQYITRMNHYSSIQAKEFVHDSKDIQIDSKFIFKKFYSELLSRLFAQRGINDGSHGLCLSLLQSISEASVAMKVWDLNGFPETDKAQEEELIEEISQFKKELAYWIADWKVENNTGFIKLFWKIRRKLYF